jgi:F-type H+-transporting ATPase subunit alpha
VAGPLKLAYAQFEELEAFARFGAKLDEDTRSQLERGRRVREALKQEEAAPITVARQIALLLAVVEGLFDAMPLEAMAATTAAVVKAVSATAEARELEKGAPLKDDRRQAILRVARAVLREAT